MRFCRVMLFAGFSFIASTLYGQDMPGATRGATFQVGGGFSAANPDYSRKWITGVSVYADADLRRHIGIEFDYHYINLNTPFDLGEVTYLVGLRYSVNIHRFHPYVKGMLGLGTFEIEKDYYHNSSSNTYMAAAFGGGVEMPLTGHLNLRVIDAEFQRWPSFPPNGLSPFALTSGLAYRF